MKKNLCECILQQETGARICERNNSADTKINEEGGVGGAPGAGVEEEEPAALGEEHGEADCPSAAHEGPCWSRYPPVAHGGPHA